MASLVERSVTDTPNLRPYSAQWYASVCDVLGEAACRHLGFYIIPDDLILSVVIPIYNEERTLRTIVERVKEVPVRTELILVDDCSSDGSRAIMEELAEEYSEDGGVKLAFHEKNRGKGAAIAPPDQ